MKTIPLTQGKVALVDDEDYEQLSAFKWCYAKCGLAGYATRGIYKDGNVKLQRMHRFIMQAADGTCVDHRNFNTLDNRRQNLRICSKHQNMMNRPKYHRGTSKFKGVSVCGNKWESGISWKDKTIVIGRFSSEFDAAIAYDAAAQVLYGEFAWLNFPLAAAA